jgi:hypothetical protein
MFQQPNCRAASGLGPEGLNRHRHEGQGGGHLPIHVPLGRFPGSGRKPGGARSAPNKGRSRWVDDGNVTHHEMARKAGAVSDDWTHVMLQHVLVDRKSHNAEQLTEQQQECWRALRTSEGATCRASALEAHWAACQTAR